MSAHSDGEYKNGNLGGRSSRGTFSNLKISYLSDTTLNHDSMHVFPKIISFNGSSAALNQISALSFHSIYYFGKYMMLSSDFVWSHHLFLYPIFNNSSIPIKNDYSSRSHAAIQPNLALNFPRLIVFAISTSCYLLWEYTNILMCGFLKFLGPVVGWVHNLIIYPIYNLFLSFCGMLLLILELGLSWVCGLYSLLTLSLMITYELIALNISSFYVSCNSYFSDMAIQPLVPSVALRDYLILTRRVFLISGYSCVITIYIISSYLLLLLSIISSPNPFFYLFPLIFFPTFEFSCIQVLKECCCIDSEGNLISLELKFSNVRVFLAVRFNLELYGHLTPFLGLHLDHPVLDGW